MLLGLVFRMYQLTQLAMDGVGSYVPYALHSYGMVILLWSSIRQPNKSNTLANLSGLCANLLKRTSEIFFVAFLFIMSKFEIVRAKGIQFFFSTFQMTVHCLKYLIV